MKPRVLTVMAGFLPLAASAAEPLRVEPWAPAHISSPLFESHPAFDPITGDLYFVRSSKTFEGWRIFKSHCAENGWSEPQPAEFAGADGFEADPFFTSGGRTLYFISSRSSDGTHRRDLDIWRVDRDAQGKWGTPVRLPEPVNSTGAEWFPRPAADGWLYFGSSRPGGHGKTDIWRARETRGRWQVENLGAAINTAGDEYEPLPSPDGKRLIIMADGGLHESHLTASGWSKRTPLPPEINVNGSEIGALFSPSGKSLLFARDTKEPMSGEFFVARFDGEESWPAACASPQSAEVDLRRMTQELLDAVAPGDKAVWERYLDDRLVYVDENGAVRSKRELIADLAPLPQGLVGHIEIASFKVELHENVAVTTHDDQEYLDYHGQPLRTRFHSTDTWLQTGDGWRLIGQQTLAQLHDPPAASLPRKQLCSYAGTYRLSDDITARVQCTAEGLSFERAGRPVATYSAEVADVFFLPGQPRSRRIFQRDARGRITGFVDRREGEDIHWVRTGM